MEAKIDIKKLEQLLRGGKTQRECAQVFKVSESAISKAKKQLVKLYKANPVILQINKLWHISFEYFN